MKAIKVSDGLYEAAREEASTTSRTIPEQVEHWAKLGAALYMTAGSHVAVNSKLRRKLHVADPADPMQVAKALLDRYVEAIAPKP